MQKNSHLNRRLVLSGPIALAALAGVHGTAFAAPSLDLASWKTGTADDFDAFLHQPFFAKMQDGSLLHMTLVDVEAGNSGSARPKNLARSEGVILTFESELGENLAKQGDHSVKMYNSSLGNFEAFLGATPRRSGGYNIELVLN
ncbi:MAG: hypothetical protein ABJO36_06090 [Litorimonas sp.]